MRKGKEGESGRSQLAEAGIDANAIVSAVREILDTNGHMDVSVTSKRHRVTE